jgi:hypothetical protein
MAMVDGALPNCFANMATIHELVRNDAQQEHEEENAHRAESFRNFRGPECHEDRTKELQKPYETWPPRPYRWPLEQNCVGRGCKLNMPAGSEHSARAASQRMFLRHIRIGRSG